MLNESRIIRYVKDNLGFPFQPLEKTDVELADYILIMTVNPGFGGQSYIEDCTEKIHKLKKYINENCDGLWISHILPMGYIDLIWKKLKQSPYRIYLHGLDFVKPRKSAWKNFWVIKIL